MTVQGCQNAPATGAIAGNFGVFAAYKLLKKSEKMSLVICVLLPEKHISLVISVPLPGKHISLVRCVSLLVDFISLGICVAG